MLKVQNHITKKLNRHNLHFSTSVFSTLDGYDTSHYLLNRQ